MYLKLMYQYTTTVQRFIRIILIFLAKSKWIFCTRGSILRSLFDVFYRMRKSVRFFASYVLPGRYCCLIVAVVAKARGFFVAGVAHFQFNTVVVCTYTVRSFGAEQP